MVPFAHGTCLWSQLEMLCPVCKKELRMTERQGIEVDYCPECRGIWLDRGELDKLIERSGRQTERYSDDQYSPPQPTAWRGRDDESQRDGRPTDQYGHKPRKRESWLSELFDWD
jgi:Zn-finger nucleic acid-binding protein